MTHIAEVLCHRSARRGVARRRCAPRAGGTAPPERARRRSRSVPAPGTFRLRRPSDGRARVSILIPFRDEPRLLRTCVDSVAATTRGAAGRAGADRQRVFRSRDPDAGRAAGGPRRRAGPARRSAVQLGRSQQRRRAAAEGDVLAVPEQRHRSPAPGLAVRPAVRRRCVPTSAQSGPASSTPIAACSTAVSSSA